MSFIGIFPLMNKTWFQIALLFIKKSMEFKTFSITVSLCCHIDSIQCCISSTKIPFSYEVYSWLIMKSFLWYKYSMKCEMINSFLFFLWTLKKIWEILRLNRKNKFEQKESFHVFLDDTVIQQPFIKDEKILFWYLVSQLFIEKTQ